MEGTCEHSDVCGRDALDGHDGKCILHSEDPDKDEEGFEQALKEHREEHGADFRWIVFPTKVDFSEETFQKWTDFTNTVFKNQVDFRNTTFKGHAVFGGTTFEGTCLFWKATFRERAVFRNANFEDSAIFRDATFEEKAVFGALLMDVLDFGEAIFEAKADFRDAIFKGAANFSKVCFGGKVLCRSTIFEEKANFVATTFKGPTVFWKVIFEKEVGFREVNFTKTVTFRENNCHILADFSRATFMDDTTFVRPFKTNDENTFVEVNFNRCRIEDDFLFTGKSIDERAFTDANIDFTNVTLTSNSSPHFLYSDLTRCRFIRTSLRDVDFTGVKWREGLSSDGYLFDEWFRRVGLYDEFFEQGQRESSEEETNGQKTETVSSWSEVERLYRQLKQNYEDRGDFPRAGDFHIGEKVARRQNPETGWGAYLLLTLYRGLSKYGERALPAALWLAVLVLGFALLYYLSGATTLATVGAVTYPEAFIHSLEATFYPVRSVGFLSFWPQLFSIVQRIISPVLIALLALALRQRVKR